VFAGEQGTSQYGGPGSDVRSACQGQSDVSREFHRLVGPADECFGNARTQRAYPPKKPENSIQRSALTMYERNIAIVMLSVALAACLTLSDNNRTAIGTLKVTERKFRLSGLDVWSGACQARSRLFACRASSRPWRLSASMLLETSQLNGRLYCRSYPLRSIDAVRPLPLPALHLRCYASHAILKLQTDAY
jgi:hypothetical protein